MSFKRGTISTHVSGVDLVMEWRIPHFSTLDETDGAEYYSPDFSFGGEEWYLQIYPNGSSFRNSSGHVSLWLGKYSSGSSIRLSFSLSLKTAEGEKFKEEHGTRYFSPCNLIHTFKRFIPRAELTRRSELLPDDVLTVICTMKGSTSAGRDSNPGFAENCSSDSDESSSDSESVECCHKCTNCSAIFKKQKKLLEELESQKDRSQACMETCTQTIEERLGYEPACAYVEACTQTLEEDSVNEHKGNSENACVNASIQTEEDNEACAPESSISPHQKKLHDDLKDLFLKREDCDIIIKVKGSEIPAHRVILQARSPVFASTFQHNMQEKATGVVEIENCDPCPFMDFLRYIYYGDVGMISQETVFDLFKLADKYEVLDLAATCLEFIKQNITMDTFCETITLALQHTETELIALATDFFLKNSEEILQTVKWQTFTAENPTQSNELVIKLVKWLKYSNM